jgi:hypothetical protein
MAESTSPDEPRNSELRHEFAVAMALGQKVSVWARKMGIPERTCYNWRQTNEFKRVVDDVQRRALERAIGQFVRNLATATDRIVHLATQGDSHSIQLSASRAVLDDFIKVRKHFELEERVTSLEERDKLRNSAP